MGTNTGDYEQHNVGQSYEERNAQDSRSPLARAVAGMGVHLSSLRGWEGGFKAQQRKPSMHKVLANVRSREQTCSQLTRQSELPGMTEIRYCYGPNTGALRDARTCAPIHKGEDRRRRVP